VDDKYRHFAHFADLNNPELMCWTCRVSLDPQRKWRCYELNRSRFSLRMWT